MNPKDPISQPINTERSAASPESKTIALGIEFNGSHYRGWQRQQAGVPSVQEELEKAISRVANHQITLQGAGRTDAGVHASNMVAHFCSPSERTEHQWLRGINTWLPKDIAVRWVKNMDPQFHARFKANARRYHYVCSMQNHPSALMSGMVTCINQAVDVSLMQEAADLIVGEHDFSSFRAAACQAPSPIKRIEFARFSAQGSLVVLDIKANGFLHHMVRNLMGTFLKVGQGELEPSCVSDILLAKDRTLAPATAPPDGLYFVNAYYPAEFQLPEMLIGPLWLNNH